MYEEGQLRLFRLMYDMAPDAIVATDPVGLITEANPAARTLFGRACKEMEDQPVFELLVDEFGQSLTDTIGRQIRDRKQIRDRHVFALRPDGVRVPVSLSVYPLIEDGEIVRVIGFFRDRSELEKLVRIDEKTGLLNERMFQERLNEFVLLGRHKHLPLAVAYFDLRGFKPINDRFGHAEGDRVIKKIGALLKANTYESDIRSRLHGDEFAVLLVRIDREHLEGVAAKLARALTFEIDLIHPKSGDMERVSIRADVGIAWREGAAIPDGKAFLELADHAMYLCKREKLEYRLDLPAS